jgi:hypothetical protein
MMSPVGTFRTYRDVGVESVMRRKADVGPTNRNFGFARCDGPILRQFL